MSLAERVKQYIESNELDASGLTGVHDIDVDLITYRILVWTEAFNRVQAQSPEVTAMIRRMVYD